MNRSKLTALLGAGLLTFALFGVAAASAPGASEQGISPVAHAGNIGAPDEGGNNKDFANCAAADAVKLSSGQATTTNGVTVHITSGVGDEAGEQDNEVDFTVDGGVVTIAYIKGGDGYNTYDYTGTADGGVTWDNDLYSPVNGSESPAGLSHAVFCTAAGSESTPTPEATPTPGGGGGGDTAQPTQPSTDSFFGTGNSGPSDTAWLLVVALGVLLASVVVLSPARAKNKR